MKIRNISLGAASLYTIIVSIFMLHAGQPTNIGWFIRALPLLAWAVGPMFLFSLFVSKFQAHKAKISLFLLQVLFFLFSVYAYYDTLYVHLYILGGLILLFLPLWQYFAIIAIAIAVKIIQSVIQNFGKSKKSPIDV